MRSSRRGFTLVELLVAIFLSALIIAAIAGTSLQVQETINTTLQRELAAQQARALFRDIETDLARMPPCLQAPPPFDQDVRNGGAPQRPIELENVAGPVEPDPAPLQEPRRADRLRIYTSLDGPTAPARQMIEYMLDQNGTAPAFVPPPGNGYYGGRLRRFVWRSDPLPNLSPPAGGPVRAENVVSFKLDWVDVKANATSEAFQNPTATTASGDEFVRQGKLDAKDFSVTAADPAGTQVLSAIPLGGELKVFDPTIPGDPGTVVLVRHRAPDAAGNVSSVLVNDRLEAKTGLQGSAFMPPSLVRVTLVLAWGKGQKAETGRFVRAFPVPR